MKRRYWLILLAGLAIVLFVSNLGVTYSSFVDTENSSGNTFTAWTSTLWTQTTMTDFNAGALNSVDISSSPGDVKLSLILIPTLITSDDNTVSVTGTTSTLVKALTFTKNGASYTELRLDSNLSIDSISGGNTAYSEIYVDDVLKTTHNTTSTSPQDYQDIVDFSTYADGGHTVTLYLYTSDTSRTAVNSTFELYYLSNGYSSSGTLTSQVLDTRAAGAKWDALFWDNILPASTNVTFEVRASDTSFVKDAASPTWTSVGGTSPVTTGLPSGRYIQWRSTLTTSDTSQTPILSEVRIYYH